MAAIVRRDVPALIAEIIQRVGRTGGTFDSRAKDLLTTSQRQVGATWFHHELAVTDNTLALTKDNRVLNFSSLTRLPLIIISVEIRDVPSDNLLPTITYQDFASLRARQVDSSTTPQYYTRFGTDLIFDAPPDKGYKLDLGYYARTAELDDTATELELAEEWDEPVMQLAVAWAARELWRPDLSSSEMQAFAATAATLTNPLLINAGLPGEPVRSAQKVHRIAGEQG